MKYSITIFCIRKGPEYLFRLFEVLPKQSTCEMKWNEAEHMWNESNSSQSLYSTVISWSTES